jgi:hypothetical protein
MPQSFYPSLLHPSLNEVKNKTGAGWWYQTHPERSWCKWIQNQNLVQQH